MLVPAPLPPAARRAAEALSDVPGVAVDAGDGMPGAPLLVVTAAGLVLVGVLDAPAGELTVTASGSWTSGGVLLTGAAENAAGLRAAASAAAHRLHAAGVPVPPPVQLLLVTGGAHLPGTGLLDVGGVLVVHAAGGGAALTARANGALIEFNTARGVYPRDVAAVDAPTLRRVLGALAVDVVLPGDAALAGHGLGSTGAVLRDDSHAAANLASALSAARPDTDVLGDTADAFRARHRERLTGRAVDRIAGLADGDVGIVELVFADDDSDGAGIGVFLAVDGRVLYVPADADEPVRLAWCSADGRPLGVHAQPPTTETLAAAGPQPVLAGDDPHRAPRVRVAGLSARVADTGRLVTSATAALSDRVGVDVPDDARLPVKQGRSGEQLVWAEAALPLGSVRLSYTEYYGLVAELPAPKAARLELVGTDAGKPTITRIGSRSALIEALRDTRPAADLSRLPDLAAEVGTRRRRLFGR